MKINVSLVIWFLILTLSSQVVSQAINPGDGVRVTLFNITDNISGDYYVQNDGNIQLPYIGLVMVLNRKFDEVKNEIISKYDSLYRNPELTVQPLFKINIFGEVGEPGPYYVTGVEKLIDVIALAGGETSDADLDEIYIIRDNEKIEVDANKLLEKGNDISDIGMKSGDQIYIPRKWFGGARNTAVIISAVAVLVGVLNILTRK